MLNFILYFCKDGILRVGFEGGKEYVPLSFLQKNTEDFNFWAYWGQQDVVFEDGVTIHSFFKALSPWIEYWGTIVGKDLKAYLKEVSTLRPISSSDDITQLDWVSIAYCTELTPEVHYNRNPDLDIIAQLNDRTPPEILPKWSMHSGYKINGYRKNETEHYSIEHSPLNVIAGLPVFLSKEQYMVVDEYFIEQYSDKKNGLINPTGLGVKHIGGEYRGKFSLVSGTKIHHLRDVIEGFFLLFHPSIANREDMHQQIIVALAEADEENEFKNHKKENNNEEGETPKEIRVATGAFDSLIGESKKMQTYWTKTVSNAKEDNQIIRIGEIKSGKAPEEKVFAFTLPT